MTLVRGQGGRRRPREKHGGDTETEKDSKELSKMRAPSVGEEDLCSHPGATLSVHHEQVPSHFLPLDLGHPTHRAKGWTRRGLNLPLALTAVTLNESRLNERKRIKRASLAVTAHTNSWVKADGHLLDPTDPWTGTSRATSCKRKPNSDWFRQ